MRRRRSLLPALLLAPVLIGACGGADPQAEIGAAIAAAATSTDPADCTRLETQSFVEQTEFTTGPAAVRACRADASDASTDPDSVDVYRVEVDGDSATARARFDGGSFDSQTLVIDVVDDRGQWKVDRIAGIVDFDTGAYASAFVRTATGGSGALRADQAACVADRIRSSRPEALETALLSGDAEQVAVAILRGCAG